jgi:hypothetical protein
MTNILRLKGTPNLSSGGIAQAKDRQPPVRSAEERQAVNVASEHRHEFGDKPVSADGKRAAAVARTVSHIDLDESTERP